MPGPVYFRSGPVYFKPEPVYFDPGPGFLVQDQFILGQGRSTLGQDCLVKLVGHDNERRGACFVKAALLCPPPAEMAIAIRTVPELCAR